VTLYREAIGEIEHLRSESGSLGTFESGRYFERLVQYEPYAGIARAWIAIGRPADALAYLERGRARSLLDLLERSRFDPLREAKRRARDRDDSELLQEIAAVAKELGERESEVSRYRHQLTIVGGRTDLDTERRRKLVAETSTHLQDARGRLRRVMRRREGLVRDVLPLARPESPEALQRLLGGDERMLVYSLAKKDGLLLVVPPTGAPIRSYKLAVTRDAVNEAVAGHLARVQAEGGRARGMTIKRRDTKPDPETLRALLPPDAWKELKGAARVYLVPHGALHRLPFETLRVEQDKTWLDAGPPIAYVPAASVLKWCRTRRDQQRGRKQQLEIVALGDPVYAADLDRLPGTRREVDSIRRSFEKSSALLGKDATESKLFELAPKARYLHLATHLLADERQQTSYSALALTLPDRPTANDDGFLKLIDLLEHWRDRLSGCELVVLSACETQRGPTQKDEAPFAMPVGFLYAGAPAVIASLWRVDDQSTADLFSDFYKRLAQGKSKLEAFTEARQALRKKYPQPYFWAPFIYIGDPR